MEGVLLLHEVDEVGRTGVWFVEHDSFVVLLLDGLVEDREILLLRHTRVTSG